MLGLSPAIIGVNPLVSNFWPCGEGKAEREVVGGRGKERGKGGKEGGQSLIFTWIDATASNRTAVSETISVDHCSEGWSFKHHTFK